MYHAENLELIRDLALICASTLGIFGLIYFYILVFIISKQITLINCKIDEEYQKVYEIERKSIDSRGTMEDAVDNLSTILPGMVNNRDKTLFSLKKKIETLIRKKENLIELVSIYKIFKK